MMQRNNLIVQTSSRGYNGAMRGITRERPIPSDLLQSIVHACLACCGVRRVRAQELGFCASCLDRSRIIAADELGGEC